MLSLSPSTGWSGELEREAKLLASLLVSDWGQAQLWLKACTPFEDRPALSDLEAAISWLCPTFWGWKREGKTDRAGSPYDTKNLLGTGREVLPDLCSSCYTLLGKSHGGSIRIACYNCVDKPNLPKWSEGPLDNYNFWTDFRAPEVWLLEALWLQAKRRNKL